MRRRVALKIVRAGIDSALVLARFDQERQALTMMDHPNIARPSMPDPRKPAAPTLLWNWSTGSR